MKTNWTRIALIVSLAFNLAVLGVFLYITALGKSPFPASANVSKTENLTDKTILPNHSGWAKNILKQNLENNRPAIEKQAKDRKEFIQTLTNDNFSEIKAKAALSKFIKSRSAMEESLGKSLIEMRKKSTPTQIKQLMQRHTEWQNKVKNKQMDFGSQVLSDKSDSLSGLSGQNIEKIKERRLERRNMIRKRLMEKYRQSQP